MNRDQVLTWNILLILLIILVFVGAWGDWFRGILEEITTYHPTKLNFSPVGTPDPAKGIGEIIDAVRNRISPPEQKPESSSGGVSTFDIPLIGGGYVHQVATDLPSAIKNVRETGNTPAIG